MAKTKAQIIEEATVLADAMEVLGVLTEEHEALFKDMTEDKKVVELEAMFAVLREDHDKAVEGDTVNEEGTSSDTDNITDTESTDGEDSTDEGTDTEAESTADGLKPVWLCGRDSKMYLIASETEEEAVATLFEMEPLFRAIGHESSRAVTVDGKELFAKE